MGALAIKRARAAVDRAISSSRAAKAQAMLVGDNEARAEQTARISNLVERQQELAREVEAGVDIAARAAKEREASPLAKRRSDTLAAMAGGDPPEISRTQFRAALVLRDYIEAASCGSPDFLERVDGGRLHNGQMEALVDRRRPVRYALNTAIDAIEDQRIWSGVIAVILYGCSFATACRLCELSSGGKQMARIKDGIVQALDAAAAHMGLSE